ncbi:MAG TPA: hypothetical protein VG963_00450, partial [Polyangiaceae bacterium]|nr:hypothetical protein [Polyangiaceae bacterium]
MPPSRVLQDCGLDPDALHAADGVLDAPWAVIRHGRLCHSFQAEDMAPEDALSVTKTMGGVVTGILAYQTRMLSEHGPKTGPLTDLDRVDHWIERSELNPDAQIGHVLGMVAPSADLTLGKRTMAYDAFATYIDVLSEVFNNVIRQDSDRLGSDLDQFTHRFLFAP